MLDDDEIIRRFKAALAYGGFGGKQGGGVPKLAEHERVKGEGGLSASTLYDVQQGRRNRSPLLSPGEMAAIAEACGLPAEFFGMDFNRAAALERVWDDTLFDHVGPGTVEGFLAQAIQLLVDEEVGEIVRVADLSSGDSDDEMFSRVAALEESVRQLLAERGGPAPPGELGHRAEGSQPTDEHPQQDEPPEEEDQQRGAEG